MFAFQMSGNRCDPVGIRAEPAALIRSDSFTSFCLQLGGFLPLKTSCMVAYVELIR